jgi:hypothetical protein
MLFVHLAAELSVLRGVMIIAIRDAVLVVQAVVVILVLELVEAVEVLVPLIVLEIVIQLVQELVPKPVHHVVQLVL